MRCKYAQNGNSLYLVALLLFSMPALIFNFAPYATIDLFKEWNLFDEQSVAIDFVSREGLCSFIFWCILNFAWVFNPFWEILYFGSVHFSFCILIGSTTILKYQSGWLNKYSEEKLILILFTYFVAIKREFYEWMIMSLVLRQTIFEKTIL